MEQRSGKVIISKSGGNASANSYGCKVSIPKTWVDNMGITPEKREITLSFDGDRITIERPEYSPMKHIPLANPKKIHRFVLLWMQIYKSHASFPYDFFENINLWAKGLQIWALKWIAEGHIAKPILKQRPWTMKNCKGSFPEWISVFLEI